MISIHNIFSHKMLQKKNNCKISSILLTVLYSRSKNLGYTGPRPNAKYWPLQHSFPRSKIR